MTDDQQTPDDADPHAADRPVLRWDAVRPRWVVESRWRHEGLGAALEAVGGTTLRFTPSTRAQRGLGLWVFRTPGTPPWELPVGIEEGHLARLHRLQGIADHGHGEGSVHWPFDLLVPVDDIGRVLRPAVHVGAVEGLREGYWTRHDLDRLAAALGLPLVRNEDLGHTDQVPWRFPGAWPALDRQAAFFGPESYWT